jgi:hypothetical protein
MIEEWQELLEQIEVRGDTFELTSEADLLEFEVRSGILLPSKYQWLSGLVSLKTI